MCIIDFLESCSIRCFQQVKWGVNRCMQLIYVGIIFSLEGAPNFRGGKTFHVQDKVLKIEDFQWISKMVKSNESVKIIESKVKSYLYANQSLLSVGGNLRGGWTFGGGKFPKVERPTLNVRIACADSPPSSWPSSRASGRARFPLTTFACRFTSLVVANILHVASSMYLEVHTTGKA